MKTFLTGALAAVTVAGATTASTLPAQARGPGAGAAVAAGIVGLGVGAAIASQPRYYYGPSPSYYAGPAYYGYYGGCRAEWRWSPRWGRYHRVTICY